MALASSAARSGRGPLDDERLGRALAHATLRFPRRLLHRGRLGDLGGRVAGLRTAAESVFDEPNPPVVALTSGTVVTGTVAWGDQPGTAVAGLPVQQLESLVREATPGELYLSKQVLTQLAPIFQQAGAQVRSQRGLVSPQPLYVVSAELAGQVTGVSVEAPAAAGFPEERRSLSDVKPGLTLGQRFEVLAELETGQMGPVFKARDRELGDLVTLRMLRPEVVSNTQLFEWLRAVIQRARAIRHPNVLAVFDFGEADGMPYISGQFERGMTLRYMLGQSGQIPLQAGLRLARQLIHGLAAVHGERLLHRGLRPENVLVEAGGNVRLADVGLTLPPRPGSAGAGAAYLAPEQLQGSEADSRADIYSLGAVLGLSGGAAGGAQTLLRAPSASLRVELRSVLARHPTIRRMNCDRLATRPRRSSSKPSARPRATSPAARSIPGSIGSRSTTASTGCGGARSYAFCRLPRPARQRVQTTAPSSSSTRRTRPPMPSIGWRPASAGSGPGS